MIKIIALKKTRYLRISNGGIFRLMSNFQNVEDISGFQFLGYFPAGRALKNITLPADAYAKNRIDVGCAFWHIRSL